MVSFIVKRLIQAVIVMGTVAFVAFGMFRFVGDPINNMVGQDTSLADQEKLRADLGLNDPVPVQFFRFIVNAVQGEFGISYRQSRPVAVLIVERLPATLELSLVASLLALAFGIGLGVYTGLRREGWLARALMAFSLVGVSLPTFLIGILLILVFSVLLNWLPSYGRGEVVQIGWWTTGFLTKSGLRALILPAITLSLFQMTLILRLVRAEMLEVLRTDYIKFARARGLSNRVIHFRHALKNTLVPVITIVGLQLGAVVAFSIITETVFQWPGMGLLFLQAVQFADIPVMSAYLILIALLYVIINLTVDLSYYLVDPRLRVDRGGGMERLLDMGVRFFESDLWWSFRRSPVTVASALVTFLTVVSAFAAPLLAPYDPFDVASLNLMDSLLPPFWQQDGLASHPLGTDNQGRDVLSTILYGSRLSLIVGGASVIFSAVLGVTLGLIAGYRGGAVDAIIMRIADVQLSFPAILTALLIDGIVRSVLPAQAHHDAAVFVLILSIGLSFWVQYARTVRGSTLVEKSKDYVQAARIIGLSRGLIMLRHVLPNVLGPVLVIATINLALAIITEATLSFLGVGVSPTEPSLGTLIRIGNDFLFSGEWWITVFPGAYLVLMILAVNLLGDWLRDALNPKLR